MYVVPHIGAKCWWFSRECVWCLRRKCACVCVCAWHAVRADSELHSHAHRSMKWGARCSYTPGSCRCRWCAQGSVPWAPLTLPVPRTYENPPGLMIIPRVVTLFDPLWRSIYRPSGFAFSRVFGRGENSFDPWPTDI